MVHPKLILIGIDAGDLQFILHSSARLPRLRALLERTAVHRLETTHLFTSSVWPTFASGAMPGDHGVYYPMQWDSEGMTLRRLTAEWLPVERFWTRLDEQGVRATVFDVPFLSPSGLRHGVEIYNWGSQECLGPVTSNRPDIARDLIRRFGWRGMGPEIAVEEPPATLRRLRLGLAESARRKAEAACWLMNQVEWDLFLTVFGETHRGGHIFWPAPHDVYEAVDRAVGELLDAAPPDAAAVVFSLHGMRSNDTQEHFMLPVMERINALYLGLPAAPAGAIRGLRESLPPRVQEWIARSVPAAARDYVVRRAFCGSLDWSRTPAFALPSSGEGYIRFNLEGREPRGILTAQTLPRFREFLRGAFLDLRAAGSGRPVCEEVVFTADSCAGARGAYLPDAVVRWRPEPPARELESPTLGRMAARLTTGRTGDHRAEGFAVFARGACPEAPPRHIAGLAAVAQRLLAPRRAYA